MDARLIAETESYDDLVKLRKRWIGDNWRRKYTHSTEDMKALDSKIRSLELAPDRY